MRKLRKYSEHRQSMLKNLSIELLEHGKIKTTLYRAKELRPFFEKLVTKAKNESLHHRRYLLSRLNNRNDAVSHLFEVGKNNKERAGGYLRLIRIRQRSDGTIDVLIRFTQEQAGFKTVEKKVAPDISSFLAELNKMESRLKDVEGSENTVEGQNSTEEKSTIKKSHQTVKENLANSLDTEEEIQNSDSADSNEEPKE